MEPVIMPKDAPEESTAVESTLETAVVQAEKTEKKVNPLFPFMAIGSAVYAFFYTVFLYKNSSGITYPFFVGGTCFFFFFYMKKSGITAKKTSLFPAVSMLLFGISTCLTASGVLIFFNKLFIFFLFFYLVLHNLYEDKKWDIPKYTGAILNIAFTSLGFLLRPFTDFSAYAKTRENNFHERTGKVKYIFCGILIALPLLFVILALLCGADAIFSNAIQHIFSLKIEDFVLKFFNNLWGISFSLLFAFFASYCIMSRISIHNLKEEIPDKRRLEPVMGITFTGLLSFVYLIFCYIQVVYLFGKAGSPPLPENYTYASYAREGFFQLVFVCLINLLLVLTCLKRFRESRVLKGILIFLSVCTYIMIASSVYRMLLYIDAYYLTFLRVFVLWALFVIFLLMTGTVIFICKNSFPFTRYCLVIVTSLYLVFSFSHPDYWIAKYNLNHSLPVANIENSKENEAYFSLETYKDFYYLTSDLSLDAAPAIFEMADELGYHSEWWFYEYGIKIVKGSCDYDYERIKSVMNSGVYLPEKLSLRKWNLSRWIARNSYTRHYLTNTEFSDKINENI